VGSGDDGADEPLWCSPGAAGGSVHWPAAYASGATGVEGPQCSACADCEGARAADGDVA
jgi:hypothetical protein